MVNYGVRTNLNNLVAPIAVFLYKLKNELPLEHCLAVIIMQYGANLPEHYAPNGQVPYYVPAPYPPTYNPTTQHGDMVPPLIMPEGPNLPQHYATNGQVPNHPAESYPTTYNPNIQHGGTIPPMHLSDPLRMPEDGIRRPMAQPMTSLQYYAFPEAVHPRNNSSNHCLRRVELQGVHRQACVTTFVGGVRDGFWDGPCDQALFSFPNGIAMDHDVNLIVADYCNNRIRKVFLNSEARKVSTVGGNDSSGAYDDDDWCRDGPFALSRFNGPKDVVVDCHNNIVVADAGNHTVRTIRRCGVVRTIAGSTELLANGGDVEVPQDTMDGKGASVRFNGPCAMLFDHDGTLLVLDNDNATCVRRVKYPT